MERRNFRYTRLLFQKFGHKVAPCEVHLVKGNKRKESNTS